ncbi:MAG: 1-deoxy-D-xylulose-5-phosphate reductoisomerase [Clostridia bacterium]|nr:1-deoxy-D-xylulose-5-phosphate reductoisomerase [Clostridia bacterium]
MTQVAAILGSTGSVGTQALDVCRKLHIKVDALSCGRDVTAVEGQIREFRPRLAAVADEKAAADLALRVADLGVTVLSGKDAAARAAEETEADTVVNAVSGIAGLRPTLATLSAGKRLALANKESLVTYGPAVMALAREKNLPILPVDSEHSAIFQCLTGQKVKKILLTASGGPFYRRSRDELSAITPADALAHPTWNMGSRITVDSATMMNKGFEVIEAVHLFGIAPEQIEVVVHRESIIHSMVEYIDNAVIAQMSRPDMRLCVQYALTYPHRTEAVIPPLDLTALSGLTFGKPDGENFPLLPLAYEAIRRGGVLPAAMNGADEEAVALFLAGRIGFHALSDLVSEVTLSMPHVASPSLDDVEAADREARRLVKEKA